MKRWGPLLLLCSVFVLYVLTTPTLYVIGDPYDELQFVLSGEPVLRSYHLLTTVLYRSGAMLLSWLPGAVMLHLEVLVIAAALFGVWAVFRTAGKGTEGLLTGGILAVSYGFWLHGSTIETGMPALAALTGAVLAAVLSQREEGVSPGWRDSAAPGRLRASAALLFTLSVLLHVQHVVLLPAMLVLLLPGWKGRDALRIAGRMLLLIILVAGGTYLAAGAGVFGLTDFAAFWSWLTTHHNQESLAHLRFGPIAVARSLSGLLRLFVDIGGAGTAVRGMLTGEGLAAFGVQQAVRLAAAAAAVVLLGWWSWKGRNEAPRMLTAAVVAAVSLLVFNSFWLGSDPQFWLGLLPFLLPLSAAGMRTMRRRWLAMASAGGLILLLLGANLDTREPSLLFPDGDDAHSQAELFRTRYAGALVLTPGSRWTSALISMNADIDVRQMFKADPSVDLIAHLDRVTDSTLRRGDAVYVEGLEHVPPEMVGIWESVESLFGISREEYHAHLREMYRLEPVTLRGEGDVDLEMFRLHPRRI